jgi:predicted kinase
MKEIVMQKFIMLVRGLPGSGKTALTDMIGLSTPSGIMARPVACSADDYFMDEAGHYVFDPKLLGEAHKACQAKAAVAVNLGRSVVVHNTFTERWEMEPYLQMAGEFDYRVIVISTFDGGCDDETLAERNSHGVPVSSIAAMRSRWQEDWGSGNPRPPWEN